MKNFNQVHNELRPRVLGYLTKITGDSNLAEDLTNETMVKVWMNFNKFDMDKGSISTWTMRITKNVLTDYWRKRQLDTVSIQGAVDEEGNEYFKLPVAETPHSVVVASELGEGIQLAINSLPKNQKRIADMFFNQELSYEEISIELNKPLGSVKSSLYRAKTMLQESILTTELV